ncbi:MAG: gamma-glutamyltransferase [Caldilineaceae bacterium]
MQGAIAAGHPQTAEAGAAMLRAGGNAVDAAVAAAFASFVAEACIVNVGGGGVALISDAAGACTAYDFFSSMPSGAFTPDADFHQVLIDFGPEQQPFHIGRASVAVPGVVAGLCRMAQERGTLPLATLLAPAVALAEEGAVLTSGQAYAYQLLEPIFRDTPALAAIYFPDGRRYQVGEAMRFPTWRVRCAGWGRTADLFYRGDLAREIVADQQRNGGLLTARDLAAYPVHTGAPIRLDYRAHTIQLMPHAPVGGVLIAFALRLLATMDVGANLHNGHAHLRLLAEVMRLTNVARADWEQSPCPWRRGGVVPGRRAHRRLRSPTGCGVGWRARPLEPAPPPGPSDTTHISVVDGNGLEVSVTTSAGENAASWWATRASVSTTCWAKRTCIPRASTVCHRAGVLSP